jgi:hypothetical protein
MRDDVGGRSRPSAPVVPVVNEACSASRAAVGPLPCCSVSRRSLFFSRPEAGELSGPLLLASSSSGSSSAPRLWLLLFCTEVMGLREGEGRASLLRGRLLQPGHGMHGRGYGRGQKVRSAARSFPDERSGTTPNRATFIGLSAPRIGGAAPGGTPTDFRRRREALAVGPLMLCGCPLLCPYGGTAAALRQCL